MFLSCRDFIYNMQWIETLGGTRHARWAHFLCTMFEILSDWIESVIHDKGERGEWKILLTDHNNKKLWCFSNERRKTAWITQDSQEQCSLHWLWQSNYTGSWIHCYVIRSQNLSQMKSAHFFIIYKKRNILFFFFFKLKTKICPSKYSLFLSSWGWPSYFIVSVSCQKH